MIREGFTRCGFKVPGLGSGFRVPGSGSSFPVRNRLFAESAMLPCRTFVLVALEAWQLADQVRREIDRITSTPAFRRYPKLQEQFLDAADSACSNTAEGFSRFKPRDFARFVRISRGSLSEILDRLISARRRGLITQSDFDLISSLARRARAACTGLINYLDAADER